MNEISRHLWNRLFIYAVAAVAIVVAVSQCARAADATFVANGGFESNAAGWKPGTPLDGWITDKIDTVAPNEMAIDTRVRHSGKASIRFTNSTHNIRQQFKITPGQLYNIRFWTRTHLTGGGFGIHVSFLDAQGKWVVNRKGQQITAGQNIYAINDWREVRIDNVRAPENAVIAHLTTIPLIDVDYVNVEGAYWIDDISMQFAPADRSTKEYISTVRVSQAANPPEIDGTLNDPAWNESAEIGSFVIPKTRTLAVEQTSAAIAYDQEALYLAVTALGGGQDSSPDGQDNIEILLSSGKSPDKQHRLLLSPTSTEDNGNPDWQIATSTVKNAWTAEVRIPFASLGVSTPKENETWRMNLIRHRAAGDEQLTAWSSTDSSNVPDDPASFGQVIFSSADALHARDAGFSPLEISVEVANPTPNPAKVLARINRRDGDTYWQYESAEVELAPGQRRQVLVPAPADDSSQFSWLTVEADGNVLLREGCVPQKEYAAVDWNDPLNVLGQKLYVANDLRTYKPIQTNHNFPNGIAGPQLIERPQRAVDLVVELPDGFRATHVVQFINNWRWWNPVEPAEVQTISYAGGQKMLRFRFELPCIFNNAENGAMVFFETDRQAGTRADGKCYLQWDTGRQPAQPLEIEVVTIGRMKPFKRMFNGMYYAEAEMLLTWLPELARDYPAIGFNRLEIDPSPEAGGAQGGANQGPSRRQWFDRLVEQARKGDLYMASSPSQSTPWAQNWMTSDPAARALDIHGNEIVDYGNLSLCVLYRGYKFQEHIDKFTKGPAFNEYGLSWLAIDLELWSDEAWAKGCFCPRCLEAYPKFMAEHYPSVEPGDPKQYMADPKTNAEKAQYWKKFREWSKMEFFRAFRTPLIECVKRHGQTSGPRPGLLVSEWLPPVPHLFDVVDYFEVNCYRKPVEVARRLGKFGVEISKERKNVAAAMGLGQTHGLDAMLTTTDMTHSLYEAAAAGVQGMVWYDVTSLDANKLKTLVNVQGAIQPFEDIIVDGACTPTIEASPAPAGARRTMLNDEALLVVRNYDASEDSTVQIRWPEPIAGPERVIRDVQTHESIGSLNAGASGFKVDVAKETSRLLYIGPAEKWEQRIGAN